MATKKKRPATARKKPAIKRPPARKTTRSSSAPAKVVAGKKAAAAKKTAAPKKVAARKKTVAPKNVAAPKKVVAPKTRAPRPAKPREFHNPQQQLAKAAPDTLSRGVPGDVPAGPAMPEGFFGAFTGGALTEQDFADAAQTLGCEVAAVKAVAEVETSGASFDANNRPTILYERHVFARSTTPPGKFNESNPDLSASKPYAPGTYGNKQQQFAKLARAYELDPDAALKAPSWGKFQILGENYKACGFSSVADYVKAMTISEAEHLKAFVKFLLSSANRLKAIRAKDWVSLAKYYNGPDYARFSYDTKLAAAYAKYSQ